MYEITFYFNVCKKGNRLNVNLFSLYDMYAVFCVCMLNMYPAMFSGDLEGKCDCVSVLKMYPVMVSGDHEGKCVCVDSVSSYGIW